MNKENILEPKAINKLLDFSFYVDSYQRGYRWGEIEVKALLNDIMEFANKENKADGEAYWLQPIIVKWVKKEVEGEKIKCYELIDGQQRLSTIFLILKVLGENSNFKIHYNTRTSSAEFLHNIDKLTKFEKWEDYVEINAEQNKIDNFYFFNAFKIIQERFENEFDEKRNLFKKALLEQTNVIWYELKGGDDMLPKTIFEQINIGKIPLTNAELVKALYLNTTIERLKRDEIAQKWDRIEYALNNDKFWAFISNDTEKEHNRIEYLLDLISGKFDCNENKQEKLHTFLYFNSVENKIETWETVESYFQTLLGWFETPEIYHYAGFLIARDFSSINELMNAYNSEEEREKPKSDFKTKLVSIITDKFRKYDIESLSYEKSADRKKIHNILLLFNIQTVLNTTPYNCFPFNEYKKEEWSLEHIYAQQSEKLTKPEAIEAWILETKPIVESFKEDLTKKKQATELCVAFEEVLLQGENMKMGNLSQLVYNFFKNNEDNDDNNVHALSNMALLDRETNSSLNNSVFPIKRRKIIDAEAIKNKFIPICTKNVFLKYYSKNVTHIQFWSEQDKIDYFKEILSCLQQFNLGGH